jgi:purine-cytosine permease-like protein
MSAGEQLGAGQVIEDEAVRGGLVEQHHVAVIPESDRHGRPRDQFTLWFAANANVVNFTLGVLAIEFGLNLFWALVGIVAGNVLGMLLTALHAWQGPRLGVPQMIQSRPGHLRLQVDPSGAEGDDGDLRRGHRGGADPGRGVQPRGPAGRPGLPPVQRPGPDRGHRPVLHEHAELNAYTGMLAFASLGTNNPKLMAAQNRQAVRLTGIIAIFVIGTVLACLSSNRFYSSFENFIGVLLFFFVPWSAINLVDYYLVRRGRYDVASFFTPDGVYGRIQWWACICYVITLAVQVPFLDQLFYVGPLVSSLGGADISWIVGFGVASLLYLAGAKRFVGVGSGLPAADPVAS